MMKTHLSILRVSAHSTQDEERRIAIQTLASLEDGDAVRTLLEIYRESHWRQNRKYVLRALGANPTHRAIEFLIDVACDTSDLGLCQEAIKSLGETQWPVAARFLGQGFSTGLDVLKPVYALAMGTCQANGFGDLLLENAKNAWEDGNLLLLKNIINSFGEMKFFKSSEMIIEVLKKTIKNEAHVRSVSHTFKELARTSLFSLGQMLRDVKPLVEVEQLFVEDTFDRTLYQNVLKQIGFRSQWQVEDYIIKLMESSTIHKSLPLELNSFPFQDVKDCLNAYFSNKHLDILKWQRVCLALKVSNDPDQFLEFFKSLPHFSEFMLKKDFFTSLFKSLAWHSTSQVQNFIQDWEPLVQQSAEHYNEWYLSKVHGFPIEKTIGDNGLSDDLRALTLQNAMSCLQSLSYIGQWIRPDKHQLKKYGQFLETLIKNPLPKDLQARIMRMAAQCRYPLSLPPAVIQLAHSDKNVCKSVLLLAERCPSRQIAQICWDISQNQPHLQLALIRALTSNSHLPNQAEKSLDGILSALLVSPTEEDVLAALHYLHVRPRKSLVPLACEKLSPHYSPAIRVAAAVALSRLKDEKTVSALASCLNEEFDALKGRSLDALLEISGSAATKIVLNFFENNAENIELCDKIIRTLRVPNELKKKSLEILGRIIKKHTQHPLMEDMLLMQDRLSLANRQDLKTELGADENIRGLDLGLTKRIKGYFFLDEPVKTALRSAEIPFLQRDVFSGDVDKSTVILQYCKALDMAMESHFGKRILFPKFHQALHLFQNTLFKGGLVEEHPQPDRVIKFFELESVFTKETLPLGKMVSLSKSIMNGKILYDHWKVVDGLKAWGIMILLFTRESKRSSAAMGLHPVIRLRTSKTEYFGARLVSLQDIRNPVAHRQTLTKYPQLEQLRAEIEKTFEEFSDAFGIGIQSNS